MTASPGSVGFDKHPLEHILEYGEIDFQETVSVADYEEDR